MLPVLINFIPSVKISLTPPPPLLRSPSGGFLLELQNNWKICAKLPIRSRQTTPAAQLYIRSTVTLPACDMYFYTRLNTAEAPLGITLESDVGLSGWQFMSQPKTSQLIVCNAEWKNSNFAGLFQQNYKTVKKCSTNGRVLNLTQSSSSKGGLHTRRHYRLNVGKPDCHKLHSVSFCASHLQKLHPTLMPSFSFA